MNSYRSARYGADAQRDLTSHNKTETTTLMFCPTKRFPSEQVSSKTSKTTKSSQTGFTTNFTWTTFTTFNQVPQSRAVKLSVVAVHHSYLQTRSLDIRTRFLWSVFIFVILISGLYYCMKSESWLSVNISSSAKIRAVVTSCRLLSHLCCVTYRWCHIVSLTV